MRFNDKETQFFEIERNIYYLYGKLNFGKNKKILNDLYFLLKEENLILDSILFSYNNIDSLDFYLANELYIKIKNYYDDEDFREIITDRVTKYLFNRLSLNPFPDKLDYYYYSYLFPSEKRELENECVYSNSLIIMDYCSLCFVYTYYYLLQEKSKDAPNSFKKNLRLRQYEYIYENKILENYLENEIKSSELPTLSRLESFYHNYEEIEKTSMDFFDDVINNSLQIFFDDSEDKWSNASSYINYLDYEISIQASLRLLSDKNFYSILDKIKDLNQIISDKYLLGKFHNVYPLFLIEDEKRKKQIQLNKIKTV